MYIWASPSGKAPGFGPGIRGFESLRPSHEIIKLALLSGLVLVIVQGYAPIWLSLLCGRPFLGNYLGNVIVGGFND